MNVRFWNGNKTDTRKLYERELLEAALRAAVEAPGGRDWVVDVDETDYPQAEDEGAVLERDTDILVTVAGNRKFDGKQKIVIGSPLAQGLLGYRIVIVRAQDADAFSGVTSVADLQRFTVGIPATWADAGLFRHNGCPVLEKGDLYTVFGLIRDGACDYTTLGANEVESVLAAAGDKARGLIMQAWHLIYYPFPLVFYVKPTRPDLADRVRRGLDIIGSNGVLQGLFDRHYGRRLGRLELHSRRIVRLRNPQLPASMRELGPDLTRTPRP